MTAAGPGVYRRPFSLLAFHQRLRDAWEADVIRHNAAIEGSGYSLEPPENLRAAVLAQFPPKAARLARSR